MIVPAKIVIDDCNGPHEFLYTIVVEDTDFIPPDGAKKIGDPYWLTNGKFQKYDFYGIEFVCKIES